MDDKTVQPEELTGYRATAAELRRLADAFEALGDTRPDADERNSYLSFGFLLDTMESVNEVSRAVLGKGAATEKNGDSWYHIATGGPKFGRGYYHVQVQVPGPPDERDAELAVLRAEVQQLRAAAVLTPDAVFDHSRKPAEDMTLTLTGEVPPTDPGDLPGQEVATTYEPVTEACEIDDEDYCATHEAVHLMPPTGPGDPDAN